MADCLTTTARCRSWCFHDRDQFLLFPLRHVELVERGLEVRDHRIPLRLIDVQVVVRFLHRPTGVLARTAAQPRQTSAVHVKLESGFRHAHPRLLDRWIRIERGVHQEPLDEIVDHSRNAVGAAQSFVQRRLFDLRPSLSESRPQP